MSEEIADGALTNCDLDDREKVSNPDGVASSAAAGLISQQSVREISKTVGKLLVAERNATKHSDRLSLVLKMVQLARAVDLDPRLASSSTLQTSRTRLIARLRTAKTEVERRMRREDRLKSPAKIEIRHEVLAQLDQAAGAAGIGGGPANAGNALRTQDYGPQLVQLIQRTISPPSWDVNGGLSTIRYWRPGMALVVRAPQSIHEEISPLAGQLRQQ